jgi:hypothetical protein
MTFFGAAILLLLSGAMLSRLFAAPRTDRRESLIHRCDFCKEAILLIDRDAKSFVLHAQDEKPLYGYSVVNACGACIRERRVDGAFFSEGAEPPS